MGDVRPLALRGLPGVAAVAAAAALGAAPWAAGTALVLYLAAFVLERRLRLLAVLAAPVVLAAGAEVATVLSWEALAWVAIAFAAVAPAFATLGGGVPWVAALPLAGIIVAAPLVVAFTPWSASVLGADIAVGAQVLLMGAAALVVLTGARRFGLPRRT